jgi:hypothetical protein
MVSRLFGAFLLRKAAFQRAIGYDPPCRDQQVCTGIYRAARRHRQNKKKLKLTPSWLDNGIVGRAYDPRRTTRSVAMAGENSAWKIP